MVFVRMAFSEWGEPRVKSVPDGAHSFFRSVTNG